MDWKKVQQDMDVVRKKLVLLFQQPLGATQKASSMDAPAKGPMWISRVTIPAPADDEIVRVVGEAIQLLGNGSENYDVPTCVDIKGEWVGYRSKTDKAASEPNISEDEKYDMLMKDVKNDSVLLYAHGGAGMMGSPVTNRRMTSRLAALSGGRVFAVDYRLAPRFPFPAQIVDVLLCYFSLLYPPPGSLHGPVPASKILFIGDSFGGLIFLAVMQVLLTLNRHAIPSDKDRKVFFHGKQVRLSLPAGMALVSPYTYCPEVYPSWNRNAEYDSFLHIPIPFWMSPKFKFDDVWPTKPYRGDVYCNPSMFGHPLVSAATVTSWQGCPPVYIAVGQESGIDSVKLVAQRAVRDGVTVQWEEYEGMCHVFMINFPHWKQSDLCYDRWVAFVKKCMHEDKLTTKGCIIRFEDLRETEVDVGQLIDLTRQDVIRLLEVAGRRVDAWEEKLKNIQTKSVL